MERDGSAGAVEGGDDSRIGFVVNGVEVPFQEARLGSDSFHGDFEDEDDEEENEEIDEGEEEEEEEEEDIDDNDADGDEDYDVYDKGGGNRENTDSGVFDDGRELARDYGKDWQGDQNQKQAKAQTVSAPTSSTFGDDQGGISAESFTPGDGVLNILFKVDPSIQECKAEIDNLVAMLKRSHEHIQKLESALREAGWSKEAWEGTALCTDLLWLSVEIARDTLDRTLICFHVHPHS